MAFEAMTGIEVASEAVTGTKAASGIGKGLGTVSVSDSSRNSQDNRTSRIQAQTWT